MGKSSVQDELNGTESAVIETKRWRPERNFRRALEKAEIAYLLSFDPEYLERQEICQKVRFAGLVDLSHPWSSGNPLAEENSGRHAGESICSYDTRKIRCAELPTITWSAKYIRRSFAFGFSRA